MAHHFRSLAIIHFFQLPKLIRTPFLLSYLISVGLILTVLIFYFRIQPFVPMFYTLALPAQQLVVKEWLWLFPAISLLITLTHLAAAQRFKNYNHLLLQLFSWITVLIQAILTLALIRIVVIVT